MSRLKDAWYKVEPRLTETLSPGKIQPLTKPTWRYRTPSHLAGAMKHHVPAGSIKLHNLLDEDSLDHIAESTRKRLWNAFITFGSASASTLGIFLLTQLIKDVINILVWGPRYPLHLRLESPSPRSNLDLDCSPPSASRPK
ncbi:hypothetical protein KM043_000396 [Ampulex compressa]|nr:hypothetical protein KM043_000396 [Ampulex compressa]